MNHSIQTMDSGIAGDVIAGKNVKVVMPSNIYGCRLGDDVFVGPFVEIQRDVVIGRRTRIQSHAFICSLVTIGTDCFISHGAKFINDRFQEGRPSFSEDDWTRTFVGNNVSIGTNATILPVRIADHVVVGAGSVVTCDLDQPGGIYAGSPARLIRTIADHTHQGAR